MPWLVELLIPLVTMLIKYISDHREEYLSQLFGKLGSIISAKVGRDSAAIIVTTNPGNAVEFDRGNDEVVKKIASDTGLVEFKQSLKKGDIVKVVAYGDGLISEDAQIVIDNENVSYCVILKLSPKI